MRGWGMVVAFSVAACGVMETDEPRGPLEQGTPVEQRVHIENDDEVLAERVHYLNEPVELLGVQSAVAGPLQLTLVARVDTPSAIRGHDLGQFDGHVSDEDRPVVNLMANMATAHGNTLVVAYHYRGTVYAGGLDVFDISTPDQPHLRSFGHFEHLDINSAIYYPADDSREDAGDGFIYATSSTCDPRYYPWNAVVERTRIVEHELTLDASYRFGLYGNIGISAATNGELLMASGGIDGAVTVVDYDNKARLADIPAADARWVAMDDERGLVLSGDTDSDGALQILDLDTLELGEPIALPGVNQLDAKNTVTLAGDRAYVAAGLAGMHVVDLTAGRIIATIPVPDDTGYDPSELTTNSVALENGLLFMGNGAAGVSIHDADSLTFLGRLDIDGSANHVAFRNGMLFIAGGTEGLHVIRVDALP